MQRRPSSLNQSKCVLHPHHSWARLIRKYLELRLSPFRMINAIDQVLRLDGHTSALVCKSSSPILRTLLVMLQWNGSLEFVARVHDQCLLICV